MSYKSKNIGIILYNIYVDTHVFRWNKTGTRRVSSNSIWPWGMWPNSARVYFYRQCPSCKLSPRGNTHFYRSLCIRPRSRGKRRTHGCQCRMSPQSSVLQREIKRRDIIWALILWYFRALWNLFLAILCTFPRWDDISQLQNCSTRIFWRVYMVA